MKGVRRLPIAIEMIGASLGSPGYGGLDRLVGSAKAVAESDHCDVWRRSVGENAMR